MSNSNFSKVAAYVRFRLFKNMTIKLLQLFSSPEVFAKCTYNSISRKKDLREKRLYSYFSISFEPVIDMISNIENVVLKKNVHANDEY